MKKKGFIFFTILSLLASLGVSGQTFFKFSGNIKNFSEPKISLTIYRNWVENPLELELKVDKKGSFYSEIALEDIAYCDLNIGDEGYFLWKIEPNDDITLSSDYQDFENTLKLTGKGSEKWLYLLEQKKKFELEKDWDYELEKLKKISRKGYFDLTKYLYDEQIALLTTYRGKVSEDFYSLQRADLYGKYSFLELGFLNYHKNFTEAEFQRFQLKTFQAKTQTKSYEFGYFVETLLENHNKIGQKYNQSIMLEYESIKSYFVEKDLVEKQLMERILANKILNYLDNFGASEETKLLVASYKEFSKNATYTNFLIEKLGKFENLKIGKEAKSFILPDEKGNLISLKDFRGKNVMLGFYASWCGPCVEDFQNLKIVENYFREQNNLVLVFINMENKDDFRTFLEKNKPLGKHLNGFENQELRKDYFTDKLPNYILIDKTGTIISDKVEEPSGDEGRALIQQIERLVK
ncbi:TlpA family protein disulfide reductase [Lacihabitans soyangensis]|uniref:TlpA family protein disulfide reductase n=1 Tax=Lacihabitans soyangensis TaxID=869394 RepID=A0AAE3H5R5_9BACT|nr:TlpA disulfide reductase family protein [Lacihabitans soyangensis]MCP9764506.1 TlpA family protein disulfide reductase [Lacihabitans soyangensis]